MDTATDWEVFSENASVSKSTSIIQGQVGNALKLTYDLTGGGFVGIKRKVGQRNLTNEGANALRFLYRATGVTNTLEIKFTDADVSTEPAKSDKLVYKTLITPDGNWREVIVPFTEFGVFRDGNGTFSSTATTHFSFGLTMDNGTVGSGTLFADGFELRQTISLIDSFDTTTNARGQSAAFFSGGGAGASSAVYVTSQAVSSTRALELNYSIPGSGFVGIEENLGTIFGAFGTERLEFYAKGSVGGEPLKMEVVDSSNVTSPGRNLSSYGTLTTTYQKFSVPLSDFTGVNLSALTKVKLLFGDNAGAGTVYIDELAIVGTGAAGQTLSVVEDFSLPESQTTFAEYVHPDAALTMEFVKDTSPPRATEDNRVARMTYSFSTSVSTPYAVAERKLSPNLHAEPAFRFRFKGDGKNNDLEIKLLDSDGTTFVREFTKVTDTNGVWKNASIPVNEFSFSAAGSNSTLDLARISTIEFAVVKREAGAGTLTIDEIESASPISFEKPNVGTVLTRVATPDNPFSPNGDGVKDSARFEYTLSQTARITLRILDLRGRPIKSFDVGDQLAGDHVIEWDALDEDGRRVVNGVYLFRLEADGSDGRDVFKQVIGVMR